MAGEAAAQHSYVSQNTVAPAILIGWLGRPVKIFTAARCELIILQTVTRYRRIQLPRALLVAAVAAP